MKSERLPRNPITICRQDAGPSHAHHPDHCHIRLTYVSADDRITLQAYVENFEDHAVLNRTAIGANRSINASYALPRTYGVKAGDKF